MIKQCFVFMNFRNNDIRAFLCREQVKWKLELPNFINHSAMQFGIFPLQLFSVFFYPRCNPWGHCYDGFLIGEIGL